MRLHPQLVTIQNISVAVAVNTTGSKYRILSNGDDPIQNHDQSYQVYFSFTQTGGATSPTSQMTLETSYDGGTTWITVVTSTQATTNTTITEVKDASSATVPLGPIVRSKLTLGGGTNPNVTAKCVLMSTGPFKTQLVA